MNNPVALGAPCIIAPNNDCANAITLVVNDVCVNGNTCGNIESGESTACSPLANQSVWYSFVATDVNMVVVVENLFTGGCDIGSSVWDGSSGCLPSGLLSCQNIFSGPPVQTHSLTGLIVSNTYYVRVEYNRGGLCDQEQTFCIKVADNIDCAGNNVCGSACPVTLDSTCYSSTLEGAVDDWGGIVGCQSNDGHPEVWFVGKPTGDTLEFTVDTTGAGFTGDIELIVASGSCGGLIIVGSSCGPAPLYFKLAITPGIKYWWTVSSSDSANGPGSTFQICVKNSGCPAFIAEAGQDAIICEGSTYTTGGAFIGGGASSSIWTTSGTGTFLDSSLEVTDYFPSFADEIAGSVTLTITTNDPDGPGPCVAASDSMVLWISQLITAFPYIQNFETQLLCGNTLFSCIIDGSCALSGGWVNASGDDIDWSIDEGGTPSTNTGPTVDHTTGSATGNYLYTEASGCFNQTAILVTPCIDKSTLTNPFLEFWYHMYGVDMGTLYIDIRIIGVGLFPGIDTISGDKGNQWRMREVDLSGLPPGVIQIIFRGVTGSSFTSDMAIDDVKIYDKPPNDVGVIAIRAPNTGCSLSASESVIIRVRNFGAEPQDTIPVSYSIGGPPINDTIFTLLNPGNAVNFTFAVTADLSATGTYTFDAWTALGTDTNNINDSITNYQVGHLIPVITFPYIENFDAFTPGTPGILLNDWLNATNDDFDWYVNAGPTPSFFTGPSADHTTGAGNYMYTEADGNIPARTALLTSPCIDISSLANPFLEFWYHMRGSSMGILYIDIDTGGVWVLSVDSIVGPQGLNWLERQVDLTAFSGIIRVRFRGLTGTFVNSDIAIDDVKIYDKPPDDVGVIIIGDPNSGCGLSASEPVTVRVKNFGLNPQDTIPLSYSVNGGPPVNDTIFIFLFNSGDTIIFTFTVPADLSTPGLYTFDAWTSLTGDGDNSNDSTMGYQVVHVAPINTFPYLEDFESGSLGEFLNSGEINTLTWVNTGIRGSDPGHSATRSAYFGNPLDTSYNTGLIEGANLTLPCIDLTLLGNVQLSFNYFLETENLSPFDDARVSISTDGVIFTPIAGNNIIGNLIDPSLTWQALTLDISAYGGFPTVYISFSFNTLDAVFNDFEGFYIDDINISEIPDTCFILSIASTNVLCFGDSNGTAATIIDSLGIAPYSYTWSDGQTDSIATGLPAGIYQVKVSDALGCTDSVNVIITQPLAALSVSITNSINVLCNGDSTGSATVTPAGGTSPYTYLWNDPNAQVDSTAIGLPAGNYQVIVNDTNDCVDSVTVTITEPLAIPLTILLDIICDNDSIFLQNAWQDTAGTYYDTLLSVNGCDSVIRTILTVISISASITGSTDVSCFGGSDGSAIVTPSGGAAPYTYSWNTVPVQFDSTVTGLPAGTYCVTVTDANGCSDTACVIIGQPLNIITFITITDVSCNGGSDGSIDLAVSGGTPPYSYAWSNSDTTQDISGVPAGTYLVIVSDSNGCALSYPGLIINEPIALSVIITDSANVLCNGDSTGSAIVTPADGVPPYTYLWNDPNAQTDSTAIGLSAGNYQVIVNDTNGCVDSATVTITEPLPIPLTTISDTICDNDSIFLQNAWQDTAGTYTDTLTGGNGCDSIVITELIVSPVFNISTPDETICDGDSALIFGTYRFAAGTYYDSLTTVNGCDSIIATTLTINSTYLFSTADETICNSDSISIFGVYHSTAGIYYDSLTTGNGCDSIITTTLLINPTYDTTASATICQGDSMQLPGGSYVSATGTYYDTLATFNGCDSVITTNLTVLLAFSSTVDTTICQGDSLLAGGTYQTISGTYFDTTIASNGCDSIITTNLNVLPVASSIIDTSICQDDSLLAGGAYQMVSGIYYDTLQASNGCDSVIVTTLSVNLITIIITGTDSICPGTCNGDATAAASGGGTPFSFIWSNSVSGPTITALCPNTYTVTVTDNNGCTATDSIIIVELLFEDPSFFYSATEYCQNDSNPIPTVTGFTPGTFSASGTLIINSTTGAIDLAASDTGNYIITYTTGGSCPNSSAFAITILTVPDATITPAGPFCGDGFPVNLSAADAGGTWSGAGIIDPINGIFDPDSAGPGIHTITYTVSNASCIDSDFVEIAVFPIPEVSATGDSIICEGDSTIIILNFTGDGPFDMAYTNGADTVYGFGIEQGGTIMFNPTVTTTYTLISLTDSLGCPGITGGTLTITVIPAPPAPVAGTDATYCAGDAMNDLTATAGSGGILTWYDDAGLTNEVGIGTAFTPPPTVGPITYYVTETVSGCASSANSVTITIYDQGSIDAGKDTTICLGESTQLQASGGTDYEWNPDDGLDNPDIADPFASPSSTTTYYVQVSINDSCVFEDSVIITVRNLKDCWEIYNTFSPNGDGKNDTWIIDGIQLYETNSVTIFNRWKDIVNEFENYDNETVVWDGTNKNSADLPDGIYFYIIDTGDEQFTGWVQVAR